jgi:hypothetical protein
MIFVNVCSTWGIFELNTRFETWKTRNDANGVRLFHLSYLITVIAYLSYQRTPNVQNKYFMYDWSIYILLMVNTSWKRDSLQMAIFEKICSTWSIVELKTRFETWITRIDVSGVSLFHLSYLITIIVYLCSQCTPHVQIMYFMFGYSIYRLFVLNRGWKRDSLQMMIYVNVCSTWCMVELKTRFETWITRNDVNGVSLFHLPYIITLKLSSQWIQNDQIKYFDDWSIYMLFVLNRSGKREYFQIMIFVYVCATWSIVELKTRFETLITRNDLNGISLFHLSKLVTLMAFLRYQRTPNIQINYFMFGRSTDYLCK